MFFSVSAAFVSPWFLGILLYFAAQYSVNTCKSDVDTTECFLGVDDRWNADLLWLCCQPWLSVFCCLFITSSCVGFDVWFLLVVSCSSSLCRYYISVWWGGICDRNKLLHTDLYCMSSLQPDRLCRREADHVMFWKTWNTWAEAFSWTWYLRNVFNFRTNVQLDSWWTV